jgi:hypothetical protein
MAGRFQFSIRFLLVSTTVIAMAVAAARLKPSPGSVLFVAAFTAMYATAAVVGAVQHAGRLRAFCLGTAVILCPASAIAVFIATANLSNIVAGSGNWSAMPAPWPIWCVAPVNGLFAVFLHWLFAPRKPSA